MLKIAICDDNKIERQIVVDKVNLYIKNNAFKADVLEFIDGEDLIEAINIQKISFDIIFLDIYMDFMNGIETAKKIREVDDTCNIIFITSSTSHAIESYHVRATYYLLKPIEDEKLHTALQIAIDRCKNASSKYIIVKDGKKFCKLSYKDILYVESMARILFIYTKQNGIIKTYKKLKDFEVELNEKRFLPCHKSFLVNLDHVLEIIDASFLMENNKRVPISSSVKNIKKAYMDHLLNKL